jgi:hypothetical protein
MREIACSRSRTMIFGADFVVFLFWPRTRNISMRRRASASGSLHGTLGSLTRARAYESFQPVQDREFTGLTGPQNRNCER